MSRSKKKTYGFCDRNPFMKNYSNRRLRRIPVKKTLSDGGSYRKHTCPWDICDWRFLLHSEQEFRSHVEYWWKPEPEGEYKNFEEYLVKERARYSRK